MSGSKVYAVTTESGAYILKHGSPGPGWRALIESQRLAASHGIAPEVAHVDDAANVVDSMQIKGMNFGQALADPLTQSAAIQSLTKQLARLHAIAVTGMAVMDPIPLMHQIWQQQSVRPGFPDWAKPLLERLKTVTIVLAADKRLVFSHCDLHPGNLIWDGSKVWLVDWERAGPAHPFLDLAILELFLDLPDDVRLYFQAAQEDKALATNDQKIYCAVRDLVRLVYGCVFFSLVPGMLTVPPLTEVPRVRDFFTRMAAGSIQLNSPTGQTLLGAAILKQFMHE
jgi:Ser/Thr protein kinase RdoA (MazF antagonist)